MLPRRRRYSSSVEQQLRLVAPVVLGQLLQRLAAAVAHAAVLGDPQQVLVRAQVVEADNARVGADQRGRGHGVVGLLEPGGERRRALAAVGHADGQRVPGASVAWSSRSFSIAACSSADAAAPGRAGRRRDGRTASRGRRGRPRPRRPRRPPPRARRRCPAAGAAWSTTCGWSRSQPSARARSARSDADAAAVGQVLEQVLDRVALGQPVDQLDAADRHGRLAGDRRRDLARLGVAAPVLRHPQRQEADQVVGDHHRHHHRRALARRRPTGSRPAGGRRRRRGGRTSPARGPARSRAAIGRASSCCGQAAPSAGGRRPRAPARRTARRPAAGARAWRRPAAARPRRRRPTTARARSASPSTSASRRRVSS